MREITWQEMCKKDILDILLKYAPPKIQDDPVLDYESCASAEMLADIITKYIEENQ